MSATLTMRISCPCGYWQYITGIKPDDPDHAKQRARQNYWHFPKVLGEPLDSNNCIVARGQCDECYKIDHEDD